MHIVDLPLRRMPLTASKKWCDYLFKISLRYFKKGQRYFEISLNFLDFSALKNGKSGFGRKISLLPTHVFLVFMDFCRCKIKNVQFPS